MAILAKSALEIGIRLWVSSGGLKEPPWQVVSPSVLTPLAHCSSGTYGRVYKAVGWNGQSGEFAIKK